MTKRAKFDYESTLDAAAVGKRLRELRIAEQISQDYASFQIQMRRQPYAMAENGERILQESDLQVLADFYQCNIEWLKTGKKPKYKKVVNDADCEI